jgi:hypothetical protein
VDGRPMRRADRAELEVLLAEATAQPLRMGSF